MAVVERGIDRGEKGGDWGWRCVDGGRIDGSESELEGELGWGRWDEMG